MGHTLVFPSVFLSFWVTMSGLRTSVVRGVLLAAETEVSPSSSCLTQSSWRLTTFCCGPYLFGRSHYIGGVKHQQINFPLQSGQQALDLKTATIQFKLGSGLNNKSLKILSPVFSGGQYLQTEMFSCRCSLYELKLNEWSGEWAEPHMASINSAYVRILGSPIHKELHSISATLHNDLL